MVCLQLARDGCSHIYLWSRLHQASSRRSGDGASGQPIKREMMPLPMDICMAPYNGKQQTVFNAPPWPPPTRRCKHRWSVAPRNRDKNRHYIIGNTPSSVKPCTTMYRTLSFEGAPPAPAVHADFSSHLVAPQKNEKDNMDPEIHTYITHLCCSPPPCRRHLGPPTYFFQIMSVPWLHEIRVRGGGGGGPQGVRRGRFIQHKTSYPTLSIRPRFVRECIDPLFFA